MSITNRNAGLIKVGFWENNSGTDAGIKEIEAVRGEVNHKELGCILEYVGASLMITGYLGWANCRACGTHLGSCDMQTPDSKFVFPEQYEHYILCHNVRPPEEFVAAAMKWSRNEG